MAPPIPSPVVTAARPGALASIGNTPLVPLLRVNPNPRVQLLAKLERSNPGGSIKDRVALAMIERAEARGELRPGQTIIEPTSGNTGIGLALVAAIKGYPIVLAMSEGVSVERRKILAALGAEFLLTPAAEGTDGAIERAYELAAAEPEQYFLPDQFNNPASILAHYDGTALEIWEQTQGTITHFVTTMGTTGTLVGCSRRLRELAPRVRIIGIEPYLGHKIQGLKNLKEAYVPGIYDPHAHDEKVHVDDDDAFEMARRLAREEGLLVGMSSGAAAHVACELARRLESGVIVTILPDGGERYLSTTLFQVQEPVEVAPPLTFLNTLARKYETFTPTSPDGPVTMYSCGPTVHERPHLGILRRLLAADLARRVLELEGHRVRHVVSITDLDDYVVAAADARGVSIGELCRQHEQEFHEDVRALNLRPADVYARASESVEAMLTLTRELVGRGHAYEKHRSVYFNIGSLPSYGELSGRDLGTIRPGETVDLERYEPADPRDFTLLRKSTLPEIRKGVGQKTEWGNVRPTWHVECSAMARAHLGPRFDIHTASVELVFPHNENELAQSRALTGHAQARYWLHSELVRVGGRQQTYDENERVTLPELVARGYSAREIRYFMLQVHYRQPVHVTDVRLAAARDKLRRLDECIRELRARPPAPRCLDEMDAWLARTREDFREAIRNDLNLPLGLGALFRLVRQLNYALAHGGVCERHTPAALEVLTELDRVLGVLELA